VVNYKITIRRGGKVLRWMPAHAELALIGREAGMETKQQTRQVMGRISSRIRRILFLQPIHLV